MIFFNLVADFMVMAVVGKGRWVKCRCFMVVKCGCYQTIILMARKQGILCSPHRMKGIGNDFPFLFGRDN